jgi:hypothetical protein
MFDGNPVEKSRMKDRFSDILMLSAFIVIAAVVSIIVMDIIIFPLSIFSINNVSVFNFLIKYISIFTLASFLIITLIRRIIFLKKNDLGNRDILLYIIKKPLIYSAAFLGTSLIIFLLLLIINLLFSNNNYLLYKIINR